jgi:hypothetical protein
MLASPRRAARVSAILVAVAMGLTVTATAIEFPPLAPAEPWRHPLENVSPSQAAAVAQAYSAGSVVSAAGTAATSDAMSLRVRILPQTGETSAHFLLAIPCGTVTTAVMTAFRQWPADGGEPADLEPPAGFAVVPLGWVRNCQVARVVVPYGAASPRGGAVEAEMGIQFEPCESALSADSEFGRAEAHGPVREMLRHAVINPDDISRFAVAAPSAIPGCDDPPPWNPAGLTSSAVRLRVPVERTGIYRITGADLESSGVALGQTNPAHLHVLLEGVPVPVFWQRAAGALPDGLGRDDVLLFLGLENPSRFTRVNTYWLVSDASSAPAAIPRRGATDNGVIEQATVFPDVCRVETDTKVVTRADQFLSILGFRWVWHELEPNKPFEFLFDIPGLAPLAIATTVTLHFHTQGTLPDPRPRLRLRLNDQPAVEETVLSAEQDAFSTAVSVSCLRERGNRAVVELLTSGTPLAPPELYLDAIELAYPRLYTAQSLPFEFRSPPRDDSDRTTRTVAYRIAAPATAMQPLVFDVTDTVPLLMDARLIPPPRALDPPMIGFSAEESGVRRYVLLTADTALTTTLEPVPGRADLRAMAQPADYIIISHGKFLATMESFVERRRADGHAVFLADIRDIYDQFASGQSEPAAIKRFLRHAATRWPASAMGPSASFVLLVGDATSAYRNEFRNDIINYVPAYAASSTYGSSNNFASDAWYVQVFGDDALADAAIGRFSVNNLNDLEAILDKQEHYRSRARPGLWENTLGFVADHNEFESPVENTMRRLVPPRFFLRRIFVSEEPWVDNYYYPAEIADAKRAKVSPRTTAKIRDMFNEGAALVTFFGHGSPNIWSNERVWFGGQSENSDNLMLSNRDRLAFIIAMTCNNGAIDYPMPRWNVNISEDFMRVPNGGAVGCYVPSGQGVTSQHEQFTADLFRGILVERTGTAIGPQLMLGGWRYLARGLPPDLVNMFILLGDPALPLRLSRPLDVGDWQPAASAGGMALPTSLAGRLAHVQYFSAAVPSVAGALLSVGTTQSAATLEPPASPPTATTRAAVAPEARGQQRSESAGGWFAQPPVLAIESWRLEDTRPTAGGSSNTLVVTVRSIAGGPLQDVRISAQAAAGDAGSAAAHPFALLPGEQREVRLPLLIPAGLTSWTLSVSAHGVRPHPAQPLQPLRTVGLRGAADAPLEVDASTLGVSAARIDSSETVVVRFDLYNVSEHTLAGLTAALTDADGRILTGTLADVPAVAPGGKTRVELRRALESDGPDREISRVRLDPFGQIAGSAKWPVWPVETGRSVLPDLVIPPGGVVASDPEPTDGDTVFFDVTVGNMGGCAVNGVRVEASERLADGAARLESRILRPTPTVDLDPGASAVVRLRWDPFRNAGQRQLVFRAVPGDNSVVESDTDNNVLVLPLRVRTKYQLRAAGLRVPPPTPEDMSQRQLRIVARIENTGESPAHGVKVVFYPAGERGKPGAALGETIIETVPPKGFAEGQIIYKLRPGDEKKTHLKFTYEAFLKGSLQRVPFEG